MMKESWRDSAIGLGAALFAIIISGFSFKYLIPKDVLRIMITICSSLIIVCFGLLRLHLKCYNDTRSLIAAAVGILLAVSFVLFPEYPEKASAFGFTTLFIGVAIEKVFMSPGYFVGWLVIASGIVLNFCALYFLPALF